MISFYMRSVKDPSLERIERFKKGCWVDVVSPTPEEIEYLKKDLGLEEENINSALDENEVPRFETEKGIRYIIIKSLSHKGSDKLNTLMIVISDSYILTLSK